MRDKIKKNAIQCFINVIGYSFFGVLFFLFIDKADSLITISRYFMSSAQQKGFYLAKEKTDFSAFNRSLIIFACYAFLLLILSVAVLFIMQLIKKKMEIRFNSKVNIIAILIMASVAVYLCLGAKALRLEEEGTAMFPEWEVSPSIAFAVIDIKPIDFFITENRIWDDEADYIYDISVTLRYKEERGYKANKHVYAGINYDKGVPYIAWLYTPKYNYRLIEYLYKNNVSEIDSHTKDALTVNFDGFFQRGYYYHIPVLTVLLPGIEDLYDGLYQARFLWKSQDISHSEHIPIEWFQKASEYGAYRYVINYQDTDFSIKNKPRTTTDKTPVNISLGSKVYIKQGSRDYTGVLLKDYVYDRPNTVVQIDGDRAVLMYDSRIVAAVNTADLYFATEIQ